MTWIEHAFILMMAGKYGADYEIIMSKEMSIAGFESTPFCNVKSVKSRSCPPALHHTEINVNFYNQSITRIYREKLSFCCWSKRGGAEELWFAFFVYGDMALAARTVHFGKGSSITNSPR